jgi:orotidine-5'-phosphate decarboxylase
MERKRPLRPATPLEIFTGRLGIRRESCFSRPHPREGAPAMTANPSDRLIVALDLPTIQDAEAMAERLSAHVSFFKIGMELAYIGGIPLGERLMKAGKKVFFDLKLHDIPNTVERATAQIAATGAQFMTVHAYPQTLAAAAQAARGTGLGILGVTVLTSMDEDDARAAGYAPPVADLVRLRARQTMEAGAAGIVCSPLEIGSVRAAAGRGMKIVTPGVRPAGAALGDQKRVLTPAEAVRAGANHLVIGRPITQAADPAAAAAAVLAEIAGS